MCVCGEGGGGGGAVNRKSEKNNKDVKTEEGDSGKVKLDKKA